MKLIAQVKLNPSSKQHAALLATLEEANAALLATLEEANAACDAISTAAWRARVFRRLPLQKVVYHDIKDSFRLGAQILVRCIAKVADAYKLDRKVQRTFQTHGAVAFDDRNLTWYTDKHAVSIWTLAGRQFIPFSAGDQQIALLACRKGEADLVYHRGAFYLLAVCDVPEPNAQQMDGALGVDLGIVNIATDSDGDTYSGSPVEARRQWYSRRRAALQAVGTKSAKRRLRRLAGRQRRFQKNENHSISKRLVAKAERTKRAIALEALTHIRQRTRAKGPEQRARHSNWAFGQLRQFINYKALMAGVPVSVVDPKYTSQQCNACGHTERRNRRSRAEFWCVMCRHRAPADINAACNIRDRADCQTAYGVQPSG